MPITKEELVAIAKSKGVDVSKYEQALQGQQGQPLMSQMPQQTGLQGLMQPNSNGMSSPIAQALMMVAGKKPADYNQEGSDLQKLYQQEMVKEQFKDPAERAMNMKLKESLLNNREQQPIQRDEREDRLREFEIRKQGGNLRNELNQNQYVKRFREMNAAASGIDSILSDTLSRPDNTSKNVGDQALITMYNKILDPLSVVRESEYARTPDGQSLLNRISGFVQKVAAGGAGLTDQDRIEISRAAKVLINNAGDLYNKEIGQKRELAGVYGVPEDMVLSGFQDFSPYDVDKQYNIPQQQTPQNNQQSSEQPVVGGMFNGEKILKVRRIG